MICVYTIKHPASGVFYIGSTIDFYHRQNRHNHDLRHGVHHSSKLQEAFNGNPSLEWHTDEVTTEDEARQIEAQRISEHMGNPLLGNHLGNNWQHTEETKSKMSEVKLGKVHTDETLSKMSATRKGREKSPEWIDKIVQSRRKAITVDGVHYRSAIEAARAFNVSDRCALDRAASTKAKFSHWQFA